MSRVAKIPVHISTDVDVKINKQNIIIKGTRGQLSYSVHDGIKVEMDKNVINIRWDDTVKKANAHAGTARALISNMVTGVSKGFEKKLTLIGVGYRAQIKGNVLTLSLGFSDPVEYQIPEGIAIKVNSQTELLIKGNDNQQVGQIASEIRSFRPPETYKGKGVRYADEHVVKKVAKKK